MTRTLGAAALLTVVLAATLLAPHLRGIPSRPVDTEADLRTFAEAVSADNETLDHYGGRVRAELRGCILTWSTITRNDCASTGNLISQTFSVDLSQVDWLFGERDPVVLVGSTPNVDPRRIFVRPLPALPLEALPQATSSLNKQLGETFFSYGTYCRTPPTGTRNLTLFHDFPDAEEGRLLQEAVEGMIDACPINDDLRFELTVEPAE